MPGDTLQDLRLDCQHDDFGLSGDGQVVWAGANAVAAMQEFPLANVGFRDPNPIGFVPPGDEAADQAAGHVTAANKGNGDVLHHYLVMFLSCFNADQRLGYRCAARSDEAQGFFPLARRAIC